MSQIVKYAFYLILIMIVVAYYKGSSSVAGTLGNSINNLILVLQGRNYKGEFADYPTQN